MRVEPNRMDNITSNPYLNKYNKNSKPSYFASDRVEISKEAKALMDNSGDVRSDKVEKVKSLIQNGTYNISGSDIANKILKDIQTFTEYNSQRKWCYGARSC